MSDNENFVEAIFFDEEQDSEVLEDARFFFEVANENDLKELNSEDSTESLFEFEKEEESERKGVVGVQKEKFLRQELALMIENSENEVGREASDLERAISKREAFLEQSCPLLLERKVAFREKSGKASFQRSQPGLRKTSSP